MTLATEHNSSYDDDGDTYEQGSVPHDHGGHATAATVASRGRALPGLWAGWIAYSEQCVIPSFDLVI
jgi:hypothetical protein